MSMTETELQEEIRIAIESYWPGTAIVLAIAGLGFGIVSAIYWWKSSRKSIVAQRRPSIITGSGDALVTMRPFEQ